MLHRKTQTLPLLLSTQPTLRPHTLHQNPYLSTHRQFILQVGSSKFHSSCQHLLHPNHLVFCRCPMLAPSVLHCWFTSQEMKESVELSDTVYSSMLKLLGEKGDYEAATRFLAEFLTEDSRDL